MVVETSNTISPWNAMMNTLTDEVTKDALETSKEILLPLIDKPPWLFVYQHERVSLVPDRTFIRAFKAMEKYICLHIYGLPKTWTIPISMHV